MIVCFCEYTDLIVGGGASKMCKIATLEVARYSYSHTAAEQLRVTQITPLVE